MPTQKDMSVAEPLSVASLPEQLILPLQQHIGQNADPIVSRGDRVLKGQMVAKAPAYVSAPIHAPTSGTIREIGPMPVPHPSGLTAPCLVIEPDGKDEWIELKPVADYTQLDPISLRNRIREAGIVGLGGAAFPSAVKLNPGPSRKIHTLVINGAECEPYITCDQTLMSERADQVVQGIQIAMHALGVERCWIAIEDSMPTAHEGLSQAIAQCGDTKIEIKVVPTIYPTGGEKQLLKVLTGQEVPSNGLPSEIGVVCHNPGTIVAMYRAIAFGEPLISRIVTITGQGIASPRNIEALFGTPIAHLVAEAGGYQKGVERLIMGGPMMGFALHTDELPIVKATNCILAGQAGEIADPGHADPCIRCGACADACPADLLPQQLYWYSKSREFERAQDEYNLFDCIECGCCSYVCPSHIPLVQYYRFAKTEIRNAEVEKRKAEHAKERHDFRLERLEREQQEKAEAMRRKKEEIARKKADANKAASSDKPEQDAIAAAVARSEARKAEKAKQRAGTRTDNNAANDAKQAAIAAAKARAKANTEGSDSAKSQAEAAKQAAIEAAKKRAQQQAQPSASDKSADDARKSAIEAAKARAQAKQSANQRDSAGASNKQNAIEAAKQRALAKQSSAQEAPEGESKATDPKQAAIAAAKARALAKQQGEAANTAAESQAGDDPKKAAIEAAKKRALEKQSKASETDTNEEKPVDPKKAAIEAAKQRALAKQSGSNTASDDAPANSKQAAIEAAKTRALAKQQDNGDEASEPSSATDPKQAAIEAAKQRALARARDKSQQGSDDS
ncbi:eleCtron transport complex, rnfabcdge type, c subunit [gamma proteobacterium HTCC5015]|nr:eleCtron transport complex, rnfabcdge type, c subunit [gamma proteobacterium HTCC5015]